MPWVSVIPSRKVFQPGPHPLTLQAAAPEKTGPGTSLAPWRSWEKGPWNGGGGGSVRPHLFFTPLILLLPAAPHTKPQSLIPKVGRRGASFTQLPHSGPPRPALQLAQASRLALSSQSPSTLVWKLPKVSTWKILVAFV